MNKIAMRMVRAFETILIIDLSRITLFGAGIHQPDDAIRIHTLRQISMEWSCITKKPIHQGSFHQKHEGQSDGANVESRLAVGSGK